MVASRETDGEIFISITKISICRLMFFSEQQRPRRRLVKAISLQFSRSLQDITTQFILLCLSAGDLAWCRALVACTHTHSTRHRIFYGDFMQNE